MKNKGIVKIIYKKKLLGIIIKSDFKKEGLEFFTPEDYSQQLAYMNRPKGYVITSHIHNPVVRKIRFTKEVLFMKTGKVRVDFYDDKRRYVESKILNAGDVVLLGFGGHGLEFIEDTEIIEVKQGPYIKEKQAIRFNPVPKDKIKVKR